MFLKTPEYRAYEAPTFKGTITYAPQIRELSDETLMRIYEVAKGDIPIDKYLQKCREILREAQDKFPIQMKTEIEYEVYCAGRLLAGSTDLDMAMCYAQRYRDRGRVEVYEVKKKVEIVATMSEIKRDIVNLGYMRYIMDGKK
jgi:hypothetical protein